MTREEFIAGYCERSRITVDELLRWSAVNPCSCGAGICKGWAVSPKEDAVYSSNDNERRYSSDYRQD